MPDDDDPTAGVDPTDLGAVADVLYHRPPDAFVALRTAFVRAARAAGDREAARRVQALGRPTRAAWVLNRLARDAPELVEGLVTLGAELAAAQADLDAEALRALSDRRRALVRDVSRRAFELAGQDARSTAFAVEVQDTLTAAVVDPAVGEALRGGALLKAAQAAGFGPAGPELAAVPAPRRAPSSSRAVPEPAREPAAKAAAKRAAKPAATGPSAAERRAAAKAQEAERAREAQRRERIAAADAALTAAKQGLEAARSAESDAQEQVRIRREQVRDAERALGDAGLAVREARAAVRDAERRRRETR